MKKIINKIKNNKIIFLILGIIVGLAVTVSGVYAATLINAINVSFSGTSSGLTSTDMQKALDEAYNNAKTSSGIKYAFGDPSSSSTTSYIDYMNLVNSGYYEFIALYGTQKSLCIYKNGSLVCFAYGNYSTEYTHMLNVFSSSNCYDFGSGYRCDDNSFRCDIYTDGSINCMDYDYYRRCDLEASYISCSGY